MLAIRRADDPRTEEYKLLFGEPTAPIAVLLPGRLGVQLDWLARSTEPKDRGRVTDLDTTLLVLVRQLGRVTVARMPARTLTDLIDRVVSDQPTMR